MIIVPIAICVAAVIIALCLIGAYVCFRLVFYSPPKKRADYAEEFPIPQGDIYEPYRESMISYIKTVRAMPHKDMEIKSFDGLTLRGRFFEYEKGAPVELMFHGYRGCSDSDLSGGVLRCMKLGRSVAIVDHRASGKSDGRIITFGVNESRDCVSWANHLNTFLEKDTPIILTGISMGAATVMMACGRELPDNVVGVLADCGYSSAKEIIMKVMRGMKLPVRLLYPFVRLGAKLYGRFDLEENPPTEALAKGNIPVLFIHGEADDFVPCDMSRKTYEACRSEKRLVTVPGAGHGLAYMTDPEGYLNVLKEFFTPFTDKKTEL